MLRQIILVDNNEENAELFKEIFLRHMHDYELMVFASGEECLKHIGKIKPELILMEIQMPDMSGYRLFTKLREMNHLTDVPIVILSSYAMKHEIEAALEFGFDGYITKPVGIKEFIKLLKQFLPIQTIN